MTSEHKIQQIKLIHIRRGASVENDRKAFNLGELQRLKESILEQGILQPPTYRFVFGQDELGHFEIVAGERRTRAYALMAQDHFNDYHDLARYLFTLRALPDATALLIATGYLLAVSVSIPAIVRDMSDQQASDNMLLENVARVDLSPIEEAQSFQKRLNNALESPKTLAKKIGKSERHIKRRLTLLTIAPSLLPLVSGKPGGLPVSHALAMAKLSHSAQVKVARMYLQGKHKAIALTHFTLLCERIWADEAQMDMFAALDESFWADDKLELMIQEVKAKPPALELGDISETLPIIDATRTDSSAAIAANYVSALADNGLLTESQWLETVLQGLASLNISISVNRVNLIA